MLTNSSILITGGTGSFGHSFVPLTLKKYNPKRLVIFSRDEMKQWEMAKLFKDDPRVRFFIGDIRDYQRLKRAFKEVDYVIHAAAMKHVHIAEYNPDECVKTNVGGAENVINAALATNVERVVALSTDKACAPINLYGATKLTSDKLFIAANNISGFKNICFSVVRYGNVMGSNGSVMPFFMKRKDTGSLPITDPNMTRFNISLREGVQMVMFALGNAWGGELYVPKIPSYKIVDVASAIGPDCEQEIVGIRPGEKIHEEMITASDSYSTYDLGDYYVILPLETKWNLNDFLKEFNAKKVKQGFSYNSKENSMFLGVQELRGLIEKHL